MTGSGQSNQHVDFNTLLFGVLAASTGGQAESLKTGNSTSADQGTLLPESGKVLPNDQLEPGQIPLFSHGIPSGLSSTAINDPEHSAQSDTPDGSLDTTSPLQANGQQSVIDPLSISQGAIRQYLSSGHADDNVAMYTDARPDQGHGTINTAARLHAASANSELANPVVQDGNVTDARHFDSKPLPADMLTGQDNVKINHAFDIMHTGTLDAAARQDTQGQSLPIHHAAGQSILSGQYTSQPAEPRAMSMHAQVGSSDWTDELSNNIRWMTSNNFQSAEIKLHPRHLGTIEVKVDVSNDQANIHFVTSNAQVKDALETAAHRLRDMLDTSGLQLSHFGVSDNSQPGGGNRNDQALRYQFAASAANQPAANEDDSTVHDTVLTVSPRLVDYYA